MLLETSCDGFTALLSGEFQRLTRRSGLRRYTVGKITPAKNREVKPSDFRAQMSQRFPPNGSSTTPPHRSHDFKWKDYCPMVFK